MVTFALSLVILALIGFLYQYFSNTCCRALTRADLPSGAVQIHHIHNNEGKELDQNGQPKGEMEHWATSEMAKGGGPIFGVYGYSIVSLEYEIPESTIGSHVVGKEFSGWNLSAVHLGLPTTIPYDHFHIGERDEEAHSHVEAVDAREHEHEKTYLIHYMLIPHEEELRIGLSCG